MAFDFTSSYDENLMNNSFFQMLQKDFRNVFVKAIAENCVICVPKTDSFPKYLLTLKDFMTHILLPVDELPQNHFINLCGAKVKINKRIITLSYEKERQNSIPVLFQETFYTEDGLKYEVLCIEQPLDEGITTCNTITTVLKNSGDCLNLLWTECGTHETLEFIDIEVKKFLNKLDAVDKIELQVIKDSFQSLYIKCLNIFLKNSNIREKYEEQTYAFKNLQTALATYLQQGIYKKIIGVVTLLTAPYDSKLNKIIRNFSDLHFKDFEISSKYYSNVPKARLELSKINDYSTSLDKFGCLKQTIAALTDYSSKKVLDADDLLQVLSFLIIKSSLPNWYAQLEFLKLFHFLSYHSFEENNYLIVSLEAAITSINNGLFFQSYNSSQIIANNENFKNYQVDLLRLINKKGCFEEKIIYQFFHQIALGNLDNVKKYIDNDSNQLKNYSSSNLCHPLCFCEKCSTVLTRGCDSLLTINATDDQGLTALHIASMYNVPNLVEYLLTCGADCNASDCDGRTPVHYAALRGHQNALLLLLHSNADMNVRDNSSNTPLHLCSNNGHENCVKALIYFSEYLGVKLKVNQKNVRGDTPLHHAAKWGYQSIVKILMESGADPLILNKKKLSPIDYAQNETILQLLKQKCQIIEHYIKIKSLNIVSEHQSTKKSKEQINKGIQPVTTDTMKKVKKILKAVENADVNLVCYYMGLKTSDFLGEGEDEDKTGKTEKHDMGDEIKCHPLCTCTKCERSDNEITKQQNSIKSVFEKRLNVNICNSEGYTPLHVASKRGNLELVRGFIKSGASLNIQTSSSLSTPLILACQHQRLKVAKELCRAGCNVDMQDNKLNTALHYACNAGNIELVEVLLKYKPDVHLRNADGKTPLQEAKNQIFLHNTHLKEKLCG